MTEVFKVSGYGMPAFSMLANCVVASIRAGNLAGKIEARVSPFSWERCVIELGANRPVEFEQVENKAILLTFVCGRKVRIIGDPEIQGNDEVHYRAVP